MVRSRCLNQLRSVSQSLRLFFNILVFVLASPVKLEPCFTRLSVLKVQQSRGEKCKHKHRVNNVLMLIQPCLAVLVMRKASQLRGYFEFFKQIKR